jgi:type II secretion system protein H
MAERKAGFTLIELLMVVALVGILAAVVSPALGGVVARAQTSGALNRLTTDLAYARMLAVRGGRSVEVLLVDGGSCGRPRAGRVLADGYRMTVAESPPRLLRAVRLNGDAAGVCLESNNDRDIVFNSRGLLVPFENRTVWARRSRTADSLTISVLGRVARRF